MKNSATIQEGFESINQVKQIYFGDGAPQYINLATVNREDGTPYPSNVRIVHGSGLSMYFVTQSMSHKLQDIQNNPRVSGSIMVGPPKPGEGVSVFFKGVAHKLSKDENFPSFAPANEDERGTMMNRLCVDREDYADKGNNIAILSEKTDLRLCRIVLTEAWYNGGVCDENYDLEINASRDIKFVISDGEPITSRYMVDSRLPLPSNTAEVSAKEVRNYFKIFPNS